MATSRSSAPRPPACRPRCGNVVQFPTTQRGNASDVWADLNAAALTNLDRWVPPLGFTNLAKTNQGFAAEATHRPSTSKSGQRKGRALGITPHGIKDHVSGEGFAPLKLVTTYRQTGFYDAAQWLADLVGFPLRERLDAPAES